MTFYLPKKCGGAKCGEIFWLTFFLKNVGAKCGFTKKVSGQFQNFLLLLCILQYYVVLLNLISKSFMNEIKKAKLKFKNLYELFFVDAAMKCLISQKPTKLVET